MASNPFTRLLRYLKALFNGKLDQYEDPEIILNEAVREMRDNAVKNRELAVQAITQKNNLQAEVDKETRIVTELQHKAELSLKSGNEELAKQFLKEKLLHTTTLESMQTNLASAIAAVDKVKLAIRQEEDRVRIRTAEALAMKANMKQAQIQIQINKALDQFQFSENEQSWSSVQDRIRSMQSEATARAEVANTSIEAKTREMEYSAIDVEADELLANMKSSLAASPANAYTSAPQQQTLTNSLNNGTPAPAANAEKELDDLLSQTKARVNQDTQH